MVQSAVFPLAAPRHRLQWRWLPHCAPRHVRWHTLFVVFCCLPLVVECPGHAQQVQRIDTPLPDAPIMGLLATQDTAGPSSDQTAGTISGTIVDQNGNFLLAARVSLSRAG